MKKIFYTIVVIILWSTLHLAMVEQYAYQQRPADTDAYSLKHATMLLHVSASAAYKTTAVSHDVIDNIVTNSLSLIPHIEPSSVRDRSAFRPGNRLKVCVGFSHTRAPAPHFCPAA